VKVILREFGVLLQTNLWLRGKSVLNGQELDTVIECGNGNPATRRIQLDLNQDGKFKPFHTGWTWMGEYYSRSSQTEFRLPQILWQGVLYEGSFDKIRMELNWTRCPQGKLDLKFKTRQKVTGWKGVFADPRNAWKIFADSDREPQIALKAGDVPLNIHLSLKTESGKGTALVYFSSDPPLTIRNGETTPLTIGKASAEIIVRQMGTTVFVNNAFRVKNGLVRTHEKGRIVIQDTKGQQLAKGEIKTIKGEAPFFGWHFPSTLKKGDKFKVLVTGEDFLFGKFEAEKECVLGDPDSKTAENL
jgi:hypothetical protein